MKAFRGQALLLAFVLVQWTLVEGQGSFCSFFGNKSPSPQPGLQNCTWYRDSSCCVNEEINSLFNQVQVPANSNGHCRNYITYLMCYVCDPRQSNFYAQERLTVCEDFCNDLLSACQDARLQGVRLGTRYGTNGSAYCADRRFQVSNVKENCFTLEESKRTLVASSSLLKPSILLVLLLPLILVLSGSFSMTGNAGQRMTSFLLVAVVVLVICSSSSALVTDNNIKSMATSIQSSLISISNDGIQREQLQELYDNATSESNDLNVTYILTEIEQKLTALTADLDMASKAVKDAVISARTRANNLPTKSPGLASLPTSVFLDADTMFTSPALEVEYNSTFRKYASFQQSSVKIPSSVNRDAVDVYDTVEWSAGIDPMLRQTMKFRNARWAYFGAETGVYRSFPAVEWESNFAGFRTDYDPRVRPWYLAATSGPKAVGIFLDCSASMDDDGRMGIAKAAAKQIINSLTRDDQVNVICSRGNYINSGGNRRSYDPVVLGCNKKKFMRATPSNRAQLISSIDAQEGYGSGEEHNTALNTLISLFPTATDGTGGCEKILIVLTDGKDTDPRNYKHVCYDRNRGTYGCVLLRTEFSEIYSTVSFAHTSSRKIKVVGIEVGDEGSTLPGKLGCDNGGVYIQLRSSDNIRSMMSPYYSYLARLANTDNDQISPTAPYVDVSGLGRIITLSRAIYDPQDAQTLLGVVGVDAVLDDLENTLLDDQFGLSYAFLIDTEGRAIVHPRLKPSSELVDDPVYPRISSLEVHDGLPVEFDQTNGILADLMAQKTGQRTVTGPRAQQLGGLEDGVKWINNVRFTYHFSSVRSTDYAFAFVLTEADASQVMLSNTMYTPGQAHNYYHEISKYDSATRTTIGYTTNSNNYNNLAVALKASTFKLAGQAFCDPTQYLLSDEPNSTLVDSYYNSGAMLAACDAGGIFQPETRSTVWVTQPVEAAWRARSAAVSDEIIWTYFGSANGVWRSFPGSRSTRNYDPTRRPWYHRALANPPSQYATSSVYLDAGGIGKVVTVAQTVFQTRSVPSGTGLCTAATGRAGNCACSSHAQCQSLYCYGTPSMCANPTIAGVGAIDFRYNMFAGTIESALAIPGIVTADRCSQAGVSCMLVNDAAEVVYHASFASVPDGDPRNYQGVPLGYLNGAVMLDLVDRGVFDRFTFRNLQGTCQISPYAPRATDRGLILSAEQEDNYYVNRGPIPRFQNNYGCPLNQIQYQRNLTKVDFTNSVTTPFQGPCIYGDYRIFPVGDTNLLLLVIQTTTNNTGNFFNFNCHIFNNVARSGGFESKETGCATNFDDTEVRATCPTAVNYEPFCNYNSASLLACSSLLVALLATISCLL
ncbi:voltage-dependent calcium channel subunit alpha-2/delta-3-like isoform X1 [Sycon ciliatum]|uniref:voltage-dependent calcium channel subunit alpha-2/delta-3-like isoform X1 n=2 Tax=Sycon ciliatum TaxID=27933 RepID=UPI0031F6711B